MENFDEQLTKFVATAQQIINDHNTLYEYTAGQTLSIGGGTKYVKIIRTDGSGIGHSVHCFVERSTGNILKAASWRAPAKHSRGNIYDADNGASAMSAYGANYLRGLT